MRERRSMLGFGAAILLALGGFATNDLLALFAASLLAAFTVSPVREAEEQPGGAGAAQTLASQRIGPSALWWAAAITAIGSVAISRADRNATLLAGAAWCASLALVAAAGIAHDGISRDALPSAFASLRRHMPEIVEVGLITAIAFALRLVDLGTVPPVIHGDEGEMGVIARSILAGNMVPWFEASPFFSLPYLFNYLQAASLAIFGQDILGLRMLSVALGSACVPLCYWIARAGWGRLAAAASAWLLAVGALFIHFSRLGFVFIESVFGMLATLALLALAARAAAGRSAFLPYVGAGLAMGLAQYFYFASRVMPLIAAPLLVHLWRSRRASVAQVAALGAAALIAFAPLGAYFLSHADVFLDRVAFVSILKDGNTSHILDRQATFAADWWPLLQVQLARNLALFVRAGDAGGFYFQSIPAFDALSAVLAWLGLGIALARPIRYHEFALLLWSGLGLVFGGVLTIDAPSAQRLTVMLPAVCVLGGVTVSQLGRLFGPIFRGRRNRIIGACALGSVALLLLAANGDLYFRQYLNGTQGREAALVARLAQAAPPETQLVLFGAPVLYSNHGAVRFGAPNARFQDPRKATELTLRQDGGPALIFAVPAHLDDAQAIRATYDGGTWTEYTDPLGRLYMVTYSIPTIAPDTR